jgi:hypothetical protein
MALSGYADSEMSIFSMPIVDIGTVRKNENRLFI